MHLKLDYCLTCNISDNIEEIKLGMTVANQTWYGGRLMDAIILYAHARFDDIDLDAKVTVGRQRQKSAMVALGN